MEILKGRTGTVTFDVPSDLATASYEIYRDGVLIGVSNYVTPANGVATVTLPYSVVSEEGDVDVVLSFTYNDGFTAKNYTKTKTVEIVTPILSSAEIAEIFPEGTAPEVAKVEKAVRHVINAYTGQTFGYRPGVYTVEGHGEDALRLPRRLAQLQGVSTLTAALDINAFIVVSDGWYLKKAWADTTAEIESDSTYWTGWEPSSDAAPGEPGYEKESHGAVIHPPGITAAPTKWENDYPFRILGIWGYIEVPEPVKEAAKLLVNDYACSEAIYRDRFLESIKAADWRLQFSTRAWEGTGNARADHLLSEYVIADWAVI